MSGAVEACLQECLRVGVREFVVCPGARNAPLVLALKRCSGVRLWSHFEERSAAFFALGRCRAIQGPVAVVTTSGTAAAELLPATIEAHYQGRPLVLITADRPAQFRGTGAPQAIEQVGLFEPYAEGQRDVGSSQTALFDEWSGRRPWHLNVCLEEEEEIPDLTPVDEGFSPPRSRPGVTELVTYLREDYFRGVVVALGGLEISEREGVYYFLKDLAVPVLADATSGLRESLGKMTLVDGDRLLRERLPGKVLRLGDVPVGRFWRDLEQLPQVDVLNVTRTGFSGLARPSVTLTGNVHEVVRGMGEPSPIGDVHDWLPDSHRREGRLRELLDRYPDSEPGMVRDLSTLVTMGESLYLGNSLPIREWNLVAQRRVPLGDVMANRGANGIDGQLSSWFGATAEEEGAWAVFGDLTVLYDLAAPALLESVCQKGRVLVVINNEGGRIFERLPRLRGLDNGERDLMTSAHATGFEAWAAMWGASYRRVSDREDLDIEPGDKMQVIEVRPHHSQTENFWKEWESQ